MRRLGWRVRLVRDRACARARRAPGGTSCSGCGGGARLASQARSRRACAGIWRRSLSRWSRLRLRGPCVSCKQRATSDRRVLTHDFLYYTLQVVHPCCFVTSRDSEGRLLEDRKLSEEAIIRSTTAMSRFVYISEKKDSLDVRAHFPYELKCRFVVDVLNIHQVGRDDGRASACKRH